VAVGDVPFSVAVMIADVVDATPTVVIVKVALVAPPATVTAAGTVAPELLEVKPTEIPPVGAALLIVTVPVEGLPPTTDVGETVRLAAVGAVTFRVAVLVTPPSVPVIVTATFATTGVVAIANVADVAPAATVTVAGSVAFVELEVRLTTVPPGPAAPLSVAVPVEPTPPTTVVGETEMLLRVAGLIVSVAV